MCQLSKALPTSGLCQIVRLLNWLSHVIEKFLLTCQCRQLDGRLKPNRRTFSLQYQVQVINNNEQPLESPKRFGGPIADMNAANIIPIEPNPQNAQLFYYCELDPAGPISIP